MSLLAGAFFYIASHADPHQPGLPVALCFGFPATFFGIAQGVRFLRQVG